MFVDFETEVDWGQVDLHFSDQYVLLRRRTLQNEFFNFETTRNSFNEITFRTATTAQMHAGICKYKEKTS